MLALLRMDWTLCRPKLLRWSPLFLLTLAGCISGAPSGLIGTLVLVEFFVGYPIFHDLGPQSVEPYLCALPVSRGQIVGARYLSAFVAMVGVFAFTLLFAGAARALGLKVLDGLPLRDALGALVLMGGLLGGLLFLYLPFHFRFGGERGLGLFTATLLGCLLVAVARFGVQGLIHSGLQFDFQFLDRGAVKAGLAAAWVVTGGLSLGISMSAYRRRVTARPLPFALPILFLAGTLGVLAVLMPMA